jgi:hypothetical protein
LGWGEVVFEGQSGSYYRFSAHTFLFRWAGLLDSGCESLGADLSRAKDFFRPDFQKKKLANEGETGSGRRFVLWFTKSDFFSRIARPGRMERVILSGKKPIPAREKHAVNLRDQGQCTYEINGKRCENKRWIEMHHIVTRVAGGNHSAENLRTLCSAHHKMIHKTLS